MEEVTALETQKKLKIVLLLLLCKLKRLRLLSYLRRVLCREVRPLESRVSSPSNTMVEPTPPVQTGSMRILHSQREPNGVPQRLTMMVFTSTASAIMGSVRPHLPALQHRYVFYFSLHKATTTSLSPPPFLLYTHILFLSFFYFAFNKLIRSSNFFMTGNSDILKLIMIMLIYGMLDC